METTMPHNPPPVPERLFTERVGVQYGWVHATWPLARIAASSSRLTISAGFMGNYTFTPEQVLALEPWGLLSFFSGGIRIRHNVPDRPQRIVFWSLGRDDTLLRHVRDAGFIPAAPVPPPSAQARSGMAVRLSAIIAAIVAWIGYCVLPFSGLVHQNSTPVWPELIPLYVICGISCGTLVSTGFQRLVLKPGRSVGEIRPTLRLFALLTGVLAVAFSIALAVGETP